MNKSIQKNSNKKTPTAVLMVLAGLKKRETDLMKQLERVRTKMTEVSKLAKSVVVQPQQAEAPTCQFVGKNLEASIDHICSITPVLPRTTGSSHKDFLISVLRRRGPMQLKYLVQTALEYGAKTRAKNPADPMHAVLCRNQDIFYQMGNGYWALTQKYRDENFK
jgi:hypothetical protein